MAASRKTRLHTDGWKQSAQGSQTLECSDPQVNSVARTEKLRRWEFNSWSVFPHDLLQTSVLPSPLFNRRMFTSQRTTTGSNHGEIGGDSSGQTRIPISWCTGLWDVQTPCPRQPRALQPKQMSHLNHNRCLSKISGNHSEMGTICPRTPRAHG